MPKSLDRVAAAARKLETAEKAREGARDVLRTRIREAHAEGISYSKIGDAAGLSKQRIAQIVRA